MEYRWRKLRVAVIAVVAILAIYLLYSHLFRTPNIQISHSPETSVSDVNQGQLPEPTAQVGPVSIGTLEMARFSTLDAKTKQVQREFGFERLLHQEGNQWEIEKPYMNIFRPELTCYITAATGYVVLEADVTPPNPTDATLTGSVVAHIVPTPTSDVKEAFVYLDDLTFISAKSRFFTSGPVTFVSDDAQLQGAGLDIIYDDQNKRLALLRIEKLEHLRLRAREGYSLTGADSASDQSPGADSAAAAAKPQAYTCVFSGNVVIDAGQQFVAADRVSISDIIWSDGESSGQPQPPGNPPDASKASAHPPRTPPQDLGEIAVSCDNGIAVVPADSLDTLAKIAGFLTDSGAAAALQAVEDQPGRTTFAAEKIDYSLATSEALAPGLSRLTLYVRDVVDPADSEAIIPLVVTANKMTKFSPKSNQIIFEGNCLCQMARADEDILQQYTLVAPKLIVELESEQISEKHTLADVAKITALADDGSTARLSSVRWQGDEFLGGIELKCPRFEYDAREQMFLANGPGVIKADNSKIPQPQKQVGRFSMQKPCYAVVRNFEQLKYYLQTERIVADNPRERIYIDYFPITDQQSEQVTMTAGHIEADLVETTAGRYRLWTLLAKDGISFQDRGRLFEASELLYDDQKDLVLAKGSDAMPAYFNGIMFDGIEYDLATEQVRKVQIQGPGFFKIGQ